jgi:DNA-binding SARP family transcriptional activator/tetratricopeptide (TPR) repeat protein
VDAGHDVLVCRSGGYVLAVDPEQVDIHRFQRHVRGGRRELASGRPELAARQLAEGLSLWHGKALTGVPEAVRDGPASRLEELRVLAAEERVAADLALGRHEHLIPELYELVAEHPWRERLVSQLMTALHRSGRRAEALEVYGRTRQRMIDELGLEPGTDLQRLQQLLLADQPAAEPVTDAVTEDRPAPAGPASRQPSQQQSWQRLRPAELPPGIPNFVGRVHEVDRLRALLTRLPHHAVPITAVAGGAGTGKTTLVVRAAHAVADRFPGGVLFANLLGSTPGREPAPPIQVLARFLRACAGTASDVPATLEEASARFRTVTADQRLLVVLDDAGSPAQVRPLIPAGPGSAVLVTSRRVLATLDAATHLHLSGMTEPDAYSLFTSMIDPDQIGDNSDEIAAARTVVRLCGGLPLAIRIAAARLAAHPEWTPATLVSRLSDARRRLDELQYVDLDVRASFATSAASLDHNLLRLFAQLGLPNLEQFAAPAVAAMAGQSLPEIRSGLDALVEAQLLEGLGRQRYALHDLIRLYASELARTSLDPFDREDAIERGLHYYIATTRNAANVLTPPKEPRLSIGIPPAHVRVTGSAFDTPAAAADWIDAEFANLPALSRQACDGSAHPSVAIALSAAATGPLLSRGYIQTLTELAGLAIHAAETNADQRGLAQAHNDLAIGYMGTEHLDAATEHVQLALRIWTRTEDLICQAGAHTNLGILCHQRGDADAAVAHYVQALEIHRELGNRKSQAAILTNLGEMFTRRGEFRPAFGHLEEALFLYRKEGARGEGYALGKLGELHLKTGDPARAITCLEPAIQLVNEAERREFEAEFRWHLGTAHRALGRTEQGLTCQREALDLLRRTGAITADEAEAILAQPIPQPPRQLR